MYVRTATLGPLGIADAIVWVHSDDEGFIATASWSFQDLLVAEATADRSTRDVVHVDVRRPRPSASRWGIWRDGEPCETELLEGYVLFHLQWEMNRIVLERRGTTIHAAGVELGGHAVILCGATQSGKTTLAGWLASQGAGYVADEIVALNSASEALHYRRPLGLRHGGPLEPLLRYPDGVDRRFDEYEMLVAVSSLGATVMPDPPIPIGAIVFPRVDISVSSAVRSVPKSLAFDRICANAPGIARHGAIAFRQLAELVRSVPTLDLVVSDLAEARSLLLREVSDTGMTCE